MRGPLPCRPNRPGSWPPDPRQVGSRTPERRAHQTGGAQHYHHPGPDRAGQRREPLVAPISENRVPSRSKSEPRGAQPLHGGASAPGQRSEIVGQLRPCPSLRGQSHRHFRCQLDCPGCEDLVGALPWSPIRTLCEPPCPGPAHGPLAPGTRGRWHPGLGPGPRGPGCTRAACGLGSALRTSRPGPARQGVVSSRRVGGWMSAASRWRSMVASAYTDQAWQPIATVLEPPKRMVQQSPSSRWGTYGMISRDNHAQQLEHPVLEAGDASPTSTPPRLKRKVCP